jgi:LL-diaminopimelate aminotransferase
MSGREKRIVILPCTPDTGFVPNTPNEHCDVVYLCSPNNPTGVALNRDQLKKWVSWAHENSAVLLVDNAYAAFISSPNVPKSIFEIPGAKEIAIEFRSFSKTAGFTGLRCSYTIVPKEVHTFLDKKKVSLRDAWNRRQAVKTNGVAYPIQRGAEAVFSSQGQKETKDQIASYLKQAKTLREGLKQLGYSCWGGEDAPYIWWKTPNNENSWDFVDLLLEKCHLIAIPGVGFGFSGEGYVRLSTFTTSAKAKEALLRIKTQL